ncbi:hypothetical protein SS50377_24424 [Spironucleus salmonicida]|uniref:Uncharacterized protein n=2 Tax=Spironucleus TaxID=39709 RepID=V6LQP4_9EUKA|nr:hypothetical protein SS50377_24424 [Spironucleus salmonicida]|eukprot:EST46026.1 hypothetical protein SS50377_14014 [Spironucleus salmonicida]
MQIRIEQTLADIQIYLDAPPPSLQKKQIIQMTNYQPQGTQSRPKSMISHKPAKFAIQRALEKPLPKQIIPVLENGSLAPGVNTRKPNFQQLARAEMNSLKALPNPQIERLKQLNAYNNPHNFYSPLNRYQTQDHYQNLTVHDIQKHGMYNLQLRRELPQNFDLSPVLAVPGEDGKDILVTKTVSPQKVKSVDLKQSPHQKAFADMARVRLQDQETVDLEVMEMVKTRQLQQVQLHDEDLNQLDLEIVEENIGSEKDDIVAVQHWTQITHKRNYKTSEINKMMDIFIEQQEELGLQSTFQDRILFNDVQQNFELNIADNEIVRNVVYKGLFQKYAFASAEISYIIGQIMSECQFADGILLGDMLIQAGLDLYFNKIMIDKNGIGDMLVERVVDNTAEQQRRLHEAKLRQQQLEQERAKKDSELRKKLAAAFIIQNYFKFIQCKEKFSSIMSQKFSILEQNFVKTQERFVVDCQPYYSRLNNHLSENQHNLQMSLFNSIDLPLLDIEFWYDHRDQHTDQKILIFVFITDDMIIIPNILLEDKQEDYILDDKILTLLIDPRVTLCVISTNDTKIPESPVFNACDAIHNQQGGALHRLHIINIQTIDYIGKLSALNVSVPQLFILQLKNNLNILADKMQELIDKIQPDIVFQTLTTEQQLNVRLFQVLKETRLPIHQVCFDLMRFSGIMTALHETAQKTLIKFRSINPYLDIEQQLIQYTSNENFIAPTYILRPDLMVSAPGADLVYNQLGGIGITHYLNKAPFKVFQNVNSTEFYQKHGAVLCPYYTEAQIYRYLSFNMTIHGQSPRFQYVEESARSYVQFGHTMSAGSFSPIEQSYWRLVPKESFDVFVFQLTETLKRLNYKGTFECSIVLLKMGQSFQFELNQLTFGYTPRFLTHNRTLLVRAYKCIVQDRSIEISRNYYFMNGLRNQFFSTLRNELKLIKMNQVYVSICQNFGLDVVVEGNTEKQMWEYATEFLTQIQAKSGGEAQMRQLLADHAGEPLHCVQSYIEKIGTSPFYVCGVNSALEQ